MIDKSQIKNAIVSVSSHNNSAEKQFRYPVEYGAPKKTIQLLQQQVELVFYYLMKNQI